MVNLVLKKKIKRKKETIQIDMELFLYKTLNIVVKVALSCDNYIY